MLVRTVAESQGFPCKNHKERTGQRAESVDRPMLHQCLVQLWRWRSYVCICPRRKILHLSGVLLHRPKLVCGHSGYRNGSAEKCPSVSERMPSYLSGMRCKAVPKLYLQKLHWHKRSQCFSVLPMPQESSGAEGIGGIGAGCRSRYTL